MQQKQNKKRVRRMLVYTCGAVCMVMFVCVLLSQQAKMKQIKQQQQILQEEYDALQTEQERVTRMIAHVQSDAFILQYARDKLGYLLPGDIKFYRQQEQQ